MPPAECLQRSLYDDAGHGHGSLTGDGRGVNSASIFFCGIDPCRPRPTPDRARQKPVVREIPPGKHHPLLARLFAQAGLDATCYRHSALERRLPSLLRVLGVATPEEAEKALKKQPHLLMAALNSVLLGVTEFFRDAATFDALRETVLPHIIRKRSQPRIWSAACSNGQELYSVAMLLHEAGCLEGCHLLGTDCREDAIKEAQAGVYHYKSGSTLADKHRDDHDRDWMQMSPALRASTLWRTGDLLSQTEPGPWDLILWRNMSIYLTPTSSEEIWGRIAAELSPGGYVVAGKAERPPGTLGLVRVGTAVYRKAGK